MAPNPNPNLAEQLRESDPGKQPLEKARAQQLKAQILMAADRATSPSTAFSKPFRWAWLAALALSLAAILIWQRPQSFSTPKKTALMASHDDLALKSSSESRVREFRFTTPGGTRIIWQFSPPTAIQTP